MIRLTTRDVEYHHDGTRMIGTLVGPVADSPTAARATVLLLPDAYGPGPHAMDLAQKLGDEGHQVFVADLWGERRQPASPAEFGPLIAAMVQDRAAWLGRVQAAQEALMEQPGAPEAPLVLLGYCFGGSSALEHVRTGAKVAGAISVHGGLDILDDDWSSARPARILLCTGDEDPMASHRMRADLTSAMTAAGADWQMHVYSDTVHAFTSPNARDSPRPDVVAHHALSSARAWRATLDFLCELTSAARTATNPSDSPAAPTPRTP